MCNRQSNCLIKVLACDYISPLRTHTSELLIDGGGVVNSNGLMLGDNATPGLCSWKTEEHVQAEEKHVLFGFSLRHAQLYSASICRIFLNLLVQEKLNQFFLCKRRLAQVLKTVWSNQGGTTSTCAYVYVLTSKLPGHFLSSVTADNWYKTISLSHLLSIVLRPLFSTLHWRHSKASRSVPPAALTLPR